MIPEGDFIYYNDYNVEDTPFVVWRVHLENGQEGAPSRFILWLSDDSREDLAPETVFVGNENVLYCRIKNGAFPARFSRAAYYQLGAHIEEDDRGYYIPLNGMKHFIQQD